MVLFFLLADLLVGFEESIFRVFYGMERVLGKDVALYGSELQLVSLIDAGFNFIFGSVLFGWRSLVASLCRDDGIDAVTMLLRRTRMA